MLVVASHDDLAVRLRTQLEARYAFADCVLTILHRSSFAAPASNEH
jgi:hypothetical protein